jgi:hypothetical protein
MVDCLVASSKCSSHTNSMLPLRVAFIRAVHPSLGSARPSPVERVIGVVGELRVSRARCQRHGSPS